MSAAIACAAWLLVAAHAPPALHGVGAQQAPPGLGNGAVLDATFSQLLKGLPIAGLAAGIVKGDRLVWSGAYGMADIGEARQVDASTIFHTGSVSKAVTAAALMRLWQDGRFQLDDDINRYLSFPVRNPKFPAAPITFRMLLTHTSSISEISQQAGRDRIPNLYGSADPGIGLGDIVREFLVPGGKYYWDFNYRDAAPGTRYEYENVGFALIGRLVERISGRSFHEYCRTHLLAPLERPTGT